MPCLRKVPKISGFFYNIFAKARASYFKFGAQLGFAKAHHKITPEEKVGIALGWGASQNFVVPVQYLHNG